MKKYEILEHRADLKIRAFGNTKEELFKNAMIGMQQALRPEILPRTEIKFLVRGKNQKSLKDKPSGQAKIKKKIKIKSNDLSSLLIDFLSEINYLNEVNKEVYNGIKFTKFSGTKLEGEVFANEVDSFGLIIKGVTYHDLDLHQEKDGTWQATILFDI